MDKEEYARSSYEIWQQMAGGWDRERKWVWDTTRKVSEWMVDALDPQPGQTILELASGTGETGFAAAQRIAPQGRLVSTDFSPNMVEAARKESRRLGLRNVEHRVLDAQHMEDLADSSVDGVLCRFGFMLMADPAAALAETRRMLRAGGKLAFSVWGDPAQNPWAVVPSRLLMEQTGASPPEPDAPGIFAMADTERTCALLAGAGLKLQRMENTDVTWRYPDYESLWHFIENLAGGIAITLKTLSENDRAAYRRKLKTALEPFRSDKGYHLPGMTQNTLAVKS
jgi:ubiquinone/menaquinone biosynthesis C-methylase UbiE